MRASSSRSTQAYRSSIHTRPLPELHPNGPVALRRTRRTLFPSSRSNVAPPSSLRCSQHDILLANTAHISPARPPVAAAYRDLFSPGPPAVGIRFNNEARTGPEIPMFPASTLYQHRQPGKMPVKRAIRTWHDIVRHAYWLELTINATIVL